MNTLNTKWLLALLFVGTLMGALDLAIIGPALPVIQDEFGMQPRELAGLLNSYVFLQMLGALLLAKLADRHGPKPIYIASITFFALGSLLIVIAESAWLLYAGRAVQGFGAGGFFPASAAVIGARISPADRGKALGLLGAVWGLAFLLGPLLGGILLRYSWQWLFAINLPIAVLLIIGSIKMLPNGGKQEPQPFDIKGMIVLTGLMSTLMLGITNLDTTVGLANVMSLDVGGGLLAMVVLLVIFWQIEKRATDPIVDPNLFQSSQITKSCLISTGTSALQAGTIFLPALLVPALEVSAADAALLLLPGVVAATIAAPLIGRLINPLGTRLILVVSQILVGMSLYVYAFVDLTIISFLIASTLGGIGSAGLVGAPLRFIVLAETDNKNRAAAQGLLSVVSSVGRLLGAALVGAVAASYPDTISGYQMAFAYLVVLGALIMLIAMTLESKATEQLKHDHANNAQPQESG
ncbi:MAG: MFS transporter [Gammaproteobacteria bacterium]